MDEEVLLRGYRDLMASLYTAEAYYRRCVLYLERVKMRSHPLRPGSARILARIIAGLGVASPRRGHFWRLVLGAVRRRGPGAFAPAVTLAVLGEHLIRYTAEVVLPRIDAAIEALAASKGTAVPAPAAAEAQPVAPDVAWPTPLATAR
jgi:hypothetical protein